jgi:hypothetical protein
MTGGDREQVRALRELIEALDRRVPRVADVGEVAIARDAKLLRERAVKRLEELGAGDVVSDPAT